MQHVPDIRTAVPEGEALRTERYARVRAFIDAQDEEGLRCWLEAERLASWYVFAGGRQSWSVLHSRVLTAINDAHETASGRPSLLSEQVCARATERTRTRARQVTATA